MMRLFRSVTFLQDFLSALPVKDPIERLISAFKSLSLAIWMVIDHIQWAHKVGYIKLESIKKLDVIHSKAWFFVKILISHISNNPGSSFWCFSIGL